MASVTRLRRRSFPELEGLEGRALFERVRAVRSSLGLTQQEFAAAVGVNVRTVKGWESPDMPRGAPTIVSAREIAALVRAAGAPVLAAELFTSPVPAEYRRLEEIDRKLDLIMEHLGIEAE